MRSVTVLLASVFLLAGALALAACGDDDGDHAPQIRTEKGLGLGLLALNAEQAREQASGDRGDDGGGGAAPGLPADDPARGVIEASFMQAGGEGITVAGYGVATIDADMAVIEFYFGSYGVRPAEPDAGSREGSTGQVPSTQPITEADLQPVIDAIVAVGIPRSDIEFLGSPYYYDPYFSSAVLRVRVRDMGLVGAVTQAAQDASRSIDIALQSTSISYLVEDCGPLEQAALAAAVEDARDRGAAFAQALEVGLGAIVAASSYAYSPFGGSACDTGYIGPYPIGGAVYSEGQPQQVQVYASVGVTFAIQ
jgi:uncharacterized protein YggE